jgi:hypothetical protein
MTPSESEARRLMFIEERVGLSAALEFAKRTLWIYRKAVLNPKHFASTPHYRRSFIESYLFLKRYALSKSVSTRSVGQ